MLQRIATWNPARGVWETDRHAFCGHSVPYSETWPSSGMTHGGAAFGLPTSVLRMGDSESSSLLPTPDGGDGLRGGAQHPTKRRAAGHAITLQDVATNLHLLPTPTARDWKDGQPVENVEEKALLGRVAWQLLPTPNPYHSKNTETPSEWLARRADVEKRTGTRHGPALSVVVESATEGHPLYQAGNGPTLWSGDHTSQPCDGGSD